MPKPKWISVKKVAAIHSMDLYSCLAMSFYLVHLYLEQKDIFAFVFVVSKAIMEWIKNEKNPYTRELATQMAELDRMWIRAHDEYNEQYSAHRNTFKEILKGAKLIDEKVRKTDSQHKKVNKLKKQVFHELLTFSEYQELSWYPLYRHWRHRVSLSWQHVVPPVTFELQSWLISVFSVWDICQ